MMHSQHNTTHIQPGDIVKRRVNGGLDKRGYHPNWSANEFKVLSTSGNVVVVEEGQGQKAYKVSDLQVIERDEPTIEEPTALDEAKTKARGTARFAKEGIAPIKEVDPTIYNGMEIVQEFDIAGEKRRKTFRGIVAYDPRGGSRAKPYRVDYSDGEKDWLALDLIQKLLTSNSKKKLQKASRAS
jgi:hypothetical protein